MSQRYGRSAILIVASALLATACGSGPSPSAAPAASTPAAPTSSAPAPTAAPTTSPVQSPTPSTTATCVSIRPDVGFYEAGHVGTKQLTTPVSRCTTISVSDIRNPATPKDSCKRFSVGFWPLVNGSLTYTTPVNACGAGRTVLARNVPDKAQYIVLYETGPGMPNVEFKVWH